MMSIASKVIRNVRNGDLAEVLSSRVHPRKLAPSPVLGHGGHSARRINRLLEAIPGAERYLEIGLEAGYTFESVYAQVRWGVDPRPRFDVKHLPVGVHVAVTTSDEFFGHLEPEESFDVVFLDGLHTFRQTYRDLVNACRVCPEGAIIIDDVVPFDEVSAMPNQEESLQMRSRRGLGSSPYLWHGDVFRVILCIREYHPELSFRTLVGADNPQTLVWSTAPGSETTEVSETILKELECISYSDVFGDGIPETFNPRDERVATAEWAAAKR
jgi:hypothetical protein